MLILQNRWKIESNMLVYYGLRSGEFTMQRHIKISAKDIGHIHHLATCSDIENLKIITKSAKIQRLYRENILIKPDEYAPDKMSIEDAKFCKTCCANDYAIPGLELNSQGICPICEHYHQLDDMISVNPVVDDIPTNKDGLYDVAVFYTGGKDSTFLLYHLAKVKGLRVLAMTWRLPFISASAEQSIVNAKAILDNVTFIDWQVSNTDLAKFYSKLFELQNNTCACPSLAYLLFFPMLSSMKVPYIVLGNEPAQMKNLYFNNIAPKIAFRYHHSKTLGILLNIYRVLTLKKPVSIARFGYLMVVKQLVNGENFIKKFFTNKMASLDNITIALSEINGLKKMLKSSIKSVDRHGAMPAFVHIDMNSASGGVYNWDNIKSILIKEVAWVDSAVCDKGLHTSCCVEKAKEYSQFVSFRNMETTNIPFSAIELSCAVNEGAITREKAITEMCSSCGFSLTSPKEHCDMATYIINHLK